MARGFVSLPRNNSLEEFRVVIEEKKGEVKRKFAELKKLLEISENIATYRLDRIYTEEREGVKRSERTVTQLEQAKNDLNSTLVDNNTTLFLQKTNQNFDIEIAKARNSVCVVPKHISLRWSIEELKQSIENVCEVISSSTAETPVSIAKPNKIGIELQKQSEYSKHTLTTESADKEDRITSLTTHIRELEDKLTTKDTYITRSYSELKNIRTYYSNLEKELRTLKLANQLYSNTNPFTRKDYSYKTTQTSDVDYVRIPKKQMEEYETITQDLESQISLLQKQLDSKETETVILRASLDDSREELGNIRLQLQQTQQSNPTKVQSRETHKQELL